MLPTVTLTPIGVVRTPFPDRVSAPRQPYASGAEGRIELAPGLEHAICDLEKWDRLWVLFWFHLNTGWRPKVLPPRSAIRSIPCSRWGRSRTRTAGSGPTGTRCASP